MIRFCTSNKNYSRFNIIKKFSLAPFYNTTVPYNQDYILKISDSCLTMKGLGAKTGKPIFSDIQKRRIYFWES